MFEASHIVLTGIPSITTVQDPHIVLLGTSTIVATPTASISGEVIPILLDLDDL